MTGERAELERLARRWLPSGIADRFMGLVRPAIRLVESRADERSADEDPDIGTRLIYVPPGVAVSHRSAPSGTVTHPLRPLAARTVLTWPHGCEPVLMAEFGSFGEADRLLWQQQVDGQYFDAALEQFQRRIGLGGSDHQIGGYAYTVQNSIVYQAARAALGHYDYEDATFAAEAAMWTALLQLGDDDTTDSMVWGDGGLGYWAIRTTDLSARNFDQVYFESQGH